MCEVRDINAFHEFIIDHPCGIKISRDLKESAIVSIKNVSKNHMNTGYIWYTLPISKVLGSDVAFSLCFLNGILHSVVFSLINPDLYSSSWDEWSEEKQQLCANHTEEWLSSNGYKVGSYSWGEIWSSYDKKSASGGCGVRYK